MLKEHEKFIAFVLLGAALMALAVMIYMHPLPDSSANSGVLQILNMIIGSMIGAFGAAAGALLKSSTDTVKVEQPQGDPIPTQEQGGGTSKPEASDTEVPDYAR